MIVKLGDMASVLFSIQGQAYSLFMEQTGDTNLLAFYADLVERICLNDSEVRSKLLVMDFESRLGSAMG